MGQVVTGKHMGAGHKVLKSFIVHAVHPVVDFTSVTLIVTKPKLREQLETVQKEATTNILDAPRWTKFLNLLMEANLPLNLRSNGSTVFFP